MSKLRRLINSTIKAVNAGHNGLFTTNDLAMLKRGREGRGSRLAFLAKDKRDQIRFSIILFVKLVIFLIDQETWSLLYNSK